MWWHLPGVLVLGRQRQEDHEFKDNLGYIGKSQDHLLKGMSQYHRRKFIVEERKSRT